METCWDAGVEGMHQDELRRMLALSMAPGVGPATFHRLLEAFGSAEAVFSAAAPELTAVCPGLKADTIQAVLAGPNLRAVRFQEETCLRLRVRIVSSRSDAYPDPLRILPHPPPFLFMAGEWLPEDRQALAMVGTRHPSGYGTRMAREMALGLVELGFTVVSGLARGIDTLAHDTTLRAGGRTLAVLGSGLDWIYPPDNVPLARRIARQGALITEFPMGMAPHATHFPRRNRLISALSLGTLVVEAGNDSGALITADYALDQGREVFAVPGAVHEPGCQGTHKLIREGAHLAERASDILDVLQGLNQAVPARRIRPAVSQAAGFSRDSLPVRALASASLAPRRIASSTGGEPLLLTLEPPEAFPSEPAAPGAPAEGVGPADAGAAVVPSGRSESLDEGSRALLSMLGPEAQTLDAIAEKARETPDWRDARPHRLLTGLLELEIKGRVKRMPGALFRLS